MAFAWRLLAGLDGIRYMMILGAPLLVYTAWETLNVLKHYEWKGLRLKGDGPFGQTEVFRLMKILLICCGCFLIGYLFNNAVLLPYFDVKSSSKMWYLPTASAQHFADILQGWLIAWGIRSSIEPLMGVRGLSLAAAVALSCIMLGFSAKGLPGRRNQETSLAHRMVRGLLAAAYAVTTLVFIFDSVWRLYELYYLPVIVLMWPLMAVELEECRAHCVSAAKKLMVIVSCVCILFQGAYSLYFIRVDKEKLDTWTGLGYTEMNTTDQVRDCVAFMQENGYTHGMIHYWYANPMVEMSDGQLCIGPLGSHYEEKHYLELYRWGTYRSAFEAENLPERVIIWIKRQDSAGFEATFPEAPLVYDGWVFNGYEVPSDQIVS